MTTKRWTLCFLLLSAVTLTLFAGIMYVTDPLIRYGTESKLFSYYEYSELYSNPGIAKNYRYDTVLVGTSMIQNTDVQECNELLGCDMVRLPYPGGTSYNMKTILDICFASDNTVETVYWELDEHQLFGVHDAPRDPLPDYLYRSDHLQDLSYLLNLDIFFHYDLKNLRGTLQGIEQPVAREGETLTGDFSEKATLSSYNRPNKTETSASSEQYIADAKRNLESNIIPLVEANPDTEFVFFTVPFSILYWDREMQNGTFDAVMDGLEYALERLLEYENVRIYFYHDEWEIVTDLDNYKDYSHYGSWINSYMTRALANDQDRLTADNCESILNEMRDYIHSYDFDGIFAPAT